MLSRNLLCLAAALAAARATDEEEACDAPDLRTLVEVGELPPPPALALWTAAELAIAPAVLRTIHPAFDRLAVAELGEPCIQHRPGPIPAGVRAGSKRESGRARGRARRPRPRGIWGRAQG